MWHETKIELHTDSFDIYRSESILFALFVDARYWKMQGLQLLVPYHSRFCLPCRNFERVTKIRANEIKIDKFCEFIAQFRTPKIILFSEEICEGSFLRFTFFIFRTV